jgi:hypothetical protein
MGVREQRAHADRPDPATGPSAPGTHGLAWIRRVRSIPSRPGMDGESGVTGLRPGASGPGGPTPAVGIDVDDLLAAVARSHDRVTGIGRLNPRSSCHAVPATSNFGGTRKSIQGGPDPEGRTLASSLYGIPRATQDREITSIPPRHVARPCVWFHRQCRTRLLVTP